ncbi:MAG: stage III sporulation AC/AD family protein [Clostridia bacterium]|nr:stage III sporulation AC/AD family protein [Clostridia bacterium]
MNEDMLKICALAFLCISVCVIIRVVSGAVATAVRMAGIILVLGGVVIMISGVVADARSIVESFSGNSQITRYWSVMLRALGIAVLCRICTDVCRDCGESAIAGGVETAGKISILALSLPMIEEIIEYARDLLSRV